MSVETESRLPRLDFARAVTYPFEDKQWQTKLIVFLIAGFVPGLNLMLWGGYAITVARNIFRREAQPMPDWESWSDIAVRGLQSLLAAVIYYSPLALFLLILVLMPTMDTLVTLRCGLIGIVVVYLPLASCLLSGAHLRFAETDRFRVYLEILDRLRDIRIGWRVFGPYFLYQTLLSFLLIVLILVGSALLLFALSVIATTGVVLSVVMTVVLAIALVGLTAMITLAFLANGFILGTACVSVEEQYAHG